MPAVALLVAAGDLSSRRPSPCADLSARRCLDKHQPRWRAPAN